MSDDPDPGTTFIELGSWKHVVEALQHPDLSSAAYAAGMGLGERRWNSIIGLDGIEHRELRSVLQPQFSPAVVDRWMRTTVAPCVTEALEALAGARRVELVQELLRPLPVQMMTSMLGIHGAERVRLAACLPALNGGDDDWGPPARRAADELREIVVEQIDCRRRDPGDDLISALVLARRSSGRPLSEDEVVSYVRLLLLAGTDTVEHAAANVLTGLLTSAATVPMHVDGTVATAAVDEGLRWECPAVAVPRRVVRAVQLQGVTLPAGAVVLCNLRSANHDPERWAASSDYDLSRSSRRHVAFGAGAHTCLGQHLARASMSHLVEQLWRRWPSIHLDPDAPAPVVQGTSMRSPTRLDVVLG